MTTLGKRTLLKRAGALGLALTLLLPPGGGLLVAAQAQAPASPQVAPAPASTPPAGSQIQIPTAPIQAGPIHTILLFPLANGISAAGNAGGFNPDIVGARAEDAIKLRLNVIGRYKANSFSPTLPQIQRALSEPNVSGNNLSENDLTPPYDDAQKGQKIAAQVGTDGYLLGSIDALRIDPATRNVSVTVSAQLYSTATGSVVKTLAYTGKGVSYNASDDPDSLLQSAINDAAGHVVSALNGGAAEEPRPLVTPDFKRGHHDNSGSILLGILLAAAVGIAISSSHHGSSSSSSGSTGTGGSNNGGGPPPPPTITPSPATGPPTAPAL
jgi:hypothetical protein